MNWGGNSWSYGWPSKFTWVLKSTEPFLVVLKKRCNDRSRAKEILCGKDSTCQFCLVLKIKERDYGPRNVVVSKSWEWPAAGSQQENTRSSTTSKNWNQATTRMSVETDSLLEPLERMQLYQHLHFCLLRLMLNFWSTRI